MQTPYFYCTRLLFVRPSLSVQNFSVKHLNTNLPLWRIGNFLGHLHRGPHCKVHGKGLSLFSHVVSQAEPHGLKTRLFGHSK